MRIYNGWLLKIDGREYVVAGSMKIRGNQSYILRNSRGEKSSIGRDALLSSLRTGEIVWVGSVVP
jgi:hypothetical protein